MITFRFDDVCMNADMGLIRSITAYMKELYPTCRIIWAVSPMVHVMSVPNVVEQQRVFPKKLNAYSDYRRFYEVDMCQIPSIMNDEQTYLASHGIVHVDHRLLEYAAQEMSILISCSLLKTKTFVPPFNKWNHITESICEKNHIKLIKFEDGWQSMEYNSLGARGLLRHRELWYLHAREWTMDKIIEWFNNK